MDFGARLLVDRRVNDEECKNEGRGKKRLEVPPGRSKQDRQWGDGGDGRRDRDKGHAKV